MTDTPPNAPPGALAQGLHDARRLGPALIIAGLGALSASWLSEHYHAPVLLFALLLGMALNFLADEGRCKPGMEFTARAVIIGLVMSVVLGAANAYLGLKAGMTIAATYPAAVIGMAVLRIFRGTNYLKRNSPTRN